MVYDIIFKALNTDYEKGGYVLYVLNVFSISALI